MKILNLYCGIGGNRKGFILEEGDQVTAVELNPLIAEIYQKEFPNDKVIVGDAHQYLLEHFREFDFIWSSPPCPTHSKVRKKLAFKNKPDGTIFEQNKPVYPDMKLYEEIIFLDNYFKGFYCVENVIPYYEPLITPQKLGRHLFFANFELPEGIVEARGSFDNAKELADKLGYDTSSWRNVKKTLLLRNCVEPEIAKLIYIYLEKAIAQEEKRKPKYFKQTTIFDID